MVPIYPLIKRYIFEHLLWVTIAEVSVLVSVLGPASRWGRHTSQWMTAIPCSGSADGELLTRNCGDPEERAALELGSRGR